MNGSLSPGNSGRYYDTEYALGSASIGSTNPTGESGSATRWLRSQLLVEAEVSRFPDNVGHVLGSRSLRSHQSLAGRLTYLAWKGRDAVSGGAAYCRKLVGQPENLPPEKGGVRSSIGKAR